MNNIKASEFFNNCGYVIFAIAAVVIIFTVFGGVLMTNAEIKWLGIFGVKLFAISMIFGLVGAIIQNRAVKAAK